MNDDNSRSKTVDAGVAGSLQDGSSTGTDVPRLSEEEFGPRLSAVEIGVCPISQTLLTDPVIAEDEHTYNRGAIEHHIMTCQSEGKPITSPMTRQLMGNKLVPVRSLHSVVETLADRKIMTSECDKEWHKAQAQARNKKRLIEKAGDNDVNALIELGEHCLNGTGGFYVDKKRGVSQLQQAFMVGESDPEAAYKLGLHYEKEGEEQDNALALSYFSMAAAYDYDAACLSLGKLLLHHGRKHEAIYWLQKSLGPCHYKIMNESEITDARNLLQYLQTQG